MGLEIPVDRSIVPPLAHMVQAFADAGLPGMLVMVDNQMLAMGAAPPAQWADARFRFPAGTVTIVRRPTGLAVVVFGNADAALQTLQRQIVDLLTRLT